MHYILTLPRPSPWPVVSIGCALADTKALGDPRWPSLVDHLSGLRERGRRAIRIVDVNCGDGALLIHIAREARALGFLSVEGFGTAPDCGEIEEARWHSHLLHDTAIGFEFEVGNAIARLEMEAEFPADIVLYDTAARASRKVCAAAERAGRMVFPRTGSAQDHQP